MGTTNELAGNRHRPANFLRRSKRSGGKAALWLRDPHVTWKFLDAAARLERSAAVPASIFQLFTDLARSLADPPHFSRREMPVRRPGHVPAPGCDPDDSWCTPSRQHRDFEDPRAWATIELHLTGHRRASPSRTAAGSPGAPH